MARRRVRIKDDNRIPEVVAKMEELDGQVIRVGVFGSRAAVKHENSAITVGHIAAIHEFGLKIAVTDKMRGYLRSQGLFLKKETQFINIPERSYIRAGWDQHEGEVCDKAEALIRDAVSQGVSIQEVVDGVGQEARGKIQVFARDLRNPENHPFTVKRKKSSNPLVDGGQLIQSIEYEVL